MHAELMFEGSSILRRLPLIDKIISRFVGNITISCKRLLL